MKIKTETLELLLQLATSPSNDSVGTTGYSNKGR